MKSIQISLALLSLVTAYPAQIATVLPAGPALPPTVGEKCGGPDKIQCVSGYCKLSGSKDAKKGAKKEAWGVCTGSTDSTENDPQTENKGKECGGFPHVGCEENFVCELPDFRCLAMTPNCMHPIGKCVPKIGANDIQKDELHKLATHLKKCGGPKNDACENGVCLYTNIKADATGLCISLKDIYSKNETESKPQTAKEGEPKIESVVHVPETPAPPPSEPETESKPEIVD